MTDSEKYHIQVLRELSGTLVSRSIERHDALEWALAQIQKLTENGKAEDEEIYTYTPNSLDAKIKCGSNMKRFDKELTLAQKNYKRVDRAWLGATAAQLFVENPWIESFRVTLGENDFDMMVDEVRERKGIPLPSVVTTNKSLNFEEANLFVNEELAWHEVDAASAFDMSSKVIVCRERIESLLEADSISGEKAFALLFPDEGKDQ